jgi:hypothetical protein
MTLLYLLLWLFRFFHPQPCNLDQLFRYVSSTIPFAFIGIARILTYNQIRLGLVRSRLPTASGPAHSLYARAKSIRCVAARQLP